MENCIIIVDHPNVLLEGQLFSAQQKGIFKKDPADPDIYDLSWRFDIGKLLTAVAGGKKTVNVILVGSRPPEKDFVWDEAERNGFELYIHDRKAAEKEGSAGPELAAKITEIICAQAGPSILKLLTRDRELLPLITLANEKSWESEMWAFANGTSYAGEVARTVTRIKPLDNLFSKIGRYEFRWPVPISQEFEPGDQ
jgi:hypothetical protein